MARSRNIKPGFFKNDLLAEVDPLGRILFAGLWTIADREGRLEDRPRRIKAEILPYDDCNIENLLQELTNRGFILRYQVEETDYIQITNWSKHQNPHKKEATSEIPAPDEHHTSTVQEPEKHSTSPADSLNLIPDSLVPHKRVSEPTRIKVDYSEEFEEFWKTYPKERRKEKKAAYRAWKARLNAGARPEQLIRAAGLYAQECKGKQPRYIKLPKTFLGPDDHWEEYQAEPRGAPEIPSNQKQWAHQREPGELSQVLARKTMVGIGGGDPECPKAKSYQQ